MRNYLLLAAFIPLHAFAQWAGWDYDYDQEKKTWAEIQAQIPPYPKLENLRKFEMDAAVAHSYFVDAASVSVGEDGVIRYTLMVRTSGGATNVSFEGIRCDVREQKSYAFGRPDGTWSRARDPKWQFIRPSAVSGHHYLLHREYFCNALRFPATLQEINQRLRYGVQKRAPAD